MITEKEAIFHGAGVGSGCASGRLHFFRRVSAATVSEAPRSPAEEWARIERATEKTKKELLALQEQLRSSTAKGEAEIFEIHAMLLEDGDFQEAMQAELAGGKGAAEAIRSAAAHFRSVLGSLGDAYLSARAADVKDVAEQLLMHLEGRERALHAPEGEERIILVADDLTPSETVHLEKERIVGFVTFSGTPNSHTAILARAMGIPALVGVGELSLAYDGKRALLDGAAGCLTVSPVREKWEAFEKKKGRENALAKEHERYLRSLINKPAITRGGHKIRIYANIGEVHEVDAALLNGADGIGLLRSEFLYLSEKDYPSEEQLLSAYRSVVTRMQGKRIVIRTLDIGADKTADYFALPKEENPALGFRGVRICLARESLFKTQLRAVLRASAYGAVSVMFPMIVSVAEVRRCRALLEQCKAELRREARSFDERLEVGIMIETPAAAIMCESLAQEVDFFSVGTNDLLQYTLAADRQNPLVEGLCRENTEPVLRLVGLAAQAIHARGGWIGICGELAADLSLTQRFADMEIDELSVSAPYLLGLREKVTECK